MSPISIAYLRHNYQTWGEHVWPGTKKIICKRTLVVKIENYVDDIRLKIDHYVATSTKYANFIKYISTQLQLYPLLVLTN